jgi:predicted RNA-binding protein associated with RNAse of E/G family
MPGHRQAQRSFPRPFRLTGIHPPKHETFDVSARTNTDPKGFVRAVDVYALRSWGLYMARPTPGRPQFHYLESWLLPTYGIRANVFHWNLGHERDQDYYLDVADITVDSGCWETLDQYLDLVVHTGTGTELVDVDELLEAQRIGLVTPETAERAIHTAVAAIDALASHDHDLNAWMKSAGVDLFWR